MPRYSPCPGASRERSHLGLTVFLLGFGWPASDTVKQAHWLYVSARSFRIRGSKVVAKAGSNTG